MNNLTQTDSSSHQMTGENVFLENGIIGLLEILEQLFSLIRFSTSGCFFVSNINFSPAKFYWFKTQRKPTLPFPRQLLCSSL